MGERDLMGAAEMLRSGECQLCPNLRAERAGTGDTRSRGQEVAVLLSVTTLARTPSSLYKTDRRRLNF